MFDLEKALATWRHTRTHHFAFDADDLDELERHLRDQVAALVARGLDEETAYRQALREMGTYATVAHEYRKVYWRKRVQKRSLMASLLHRLDMLQSYFRMALRQIVRYKGYAAINIVGLALGMACCLLMLSYVWGEWGYDRFHASAAQMYRVNWDYAWGEQAGVGPGTPPPLAARLVEEVPGVEAAIRLYAVAQQTVRSDDQFFNESRIIAADSSFFGFFDFALIAGDPRTALAQPNSVVLTAATARKYFGTASALGQQLTLGEEKQVFGKTYRNVFTVTGIAAAPPAQSHLQFDLITSMPSHPEVAFFDWSWIWMQVSTYVRLQPGTAPGSVEAQVPALVERYAPDAFERVGFSYSELIESGGHWDFVLQPLSDLYLGAVGNRFGPTGNGLYVNVLLLIAVFTLLIACINFMNLSTARAMPRAREIGVRKAVGAPRSQLIGQFLVESVACSLLALPLAVGLVWLAAEPFSQLAGKPLVFDLVPPVWAGLVLVGFAVVVGSLAGSYPGLYLSSLQPVQVLKGKRLPQRTSRRLRYGLVIGQFTLTIALIACTLLVQQQVHYLRAADLGFVRNDLVVISNHNQVLGAQAEAFKAAVAQHSGVRSVSVSTGVPPHFGFEDYYKAEGQGEEQFAVVSYLTDADFVETLGIALVAGRSFGPDRAADVRGVVVNEAAVRRFGWTEPLGKTLEYPSQGTYTVIGVMKDFNFLTLHLPIVPFALFHEDSGSYDVPDSHVLVRLGEGDLEQSLQRLEATWNTFVPETPFTYAFLEDSWRDQHLADIRLGRIFGLFSLLTIFIACLGLLGLSAFMAEQRTKEVGVRKVLGASTSAVVLLLSKHFLQLVGVAFVLATPLAYLAMQRWLDGFAYHVPISWPVFALAGLSALLISFLTVSGHALRAARANPVESLRHE